MVETVMMIVPVVVVVWNVQFDVNFRGWKCPVISLLVMAAVAVVRRFSPEALLGWWFTEKKWWCFCRNSC